MTAWVLSRPSLGHWWDRCPQHLQRDPVGCGEHFQAHGVSQNRSEKVPLGGDGLDQRREQTRAKLGHMEEGEGPRPGSMLKGTQTCQLCGDTVSICHQEEG